MPTFIQVTDPQDSIHALIKWRRYYHRFNIMVEVRECRMPRTGVIKYTLWRALTDKEEDELARGLMEIQSNTLVLKVCNKSVRKLKSRRSNKKGGKK